MDPDGKKPRVFVETKNFGHAFIATGDGDNLTIYTMGRTGAVPSFFKKIGKPYLAPWGEGVLSVMKGNSAKEYLRERTSNGIHYSIFEFDADDSKIDDHFSELFDNGAIPTGGISYDKENARVISKYVLFYNNCVTTTVSGLEQSGIDVLSDRGTLLLSPSELISEMARSHVYSVIYIGKAAQDFIASLINEQ